MYSRNQEAKHLFWQSNTGKGAAFTALTHRWRIFVQLDTTTNKWFWRASHTISVSKNVASKSKFDTSEDAKHAAETWYYENAAEW